MASRKQEIRKEIKKKNAKLGIDVEAAKTLLIYKINKAKIYMLMILKIKNIQEKFFHFLQHHKKRKRVLFQELKVFLMMKENNLKN